MHILALASNRGLIVRGPCFGRDQAFVLTRDWLGSPPPVITVNGLFRPFALAGGRAVAAWTITGGQVVLAPFDDLDPGTRAALEADAADVTRFLG